MIHLKIKTFSELKKLKTFHERYLYLKLQGGVGVKTFGADRYLNQMFYQSDKWKKVRQKVILRDDGCDLGIPGYEITDKIYIHHMNPITPEDILEGKEEIVDPEFLICVSFNTHNAIHFSDESLLPSVPIERKPGDTKLW